MFLEGEKKERGLFRQSEVFPTDEACLGGRGRGGAKFPTGGKGETKA